MDRSPGPARICWSNSGGASMNTSRSRGIIAQVLLILPFSLVCSGPAAAKTEPLRVAVLDFNSLTGVPAGLAEAAGPQFSSLLTRLKRFKVLERAALQKILKEQALSGTGAMNDETAAKVGKLAGVQQMV